MSGIRLAAVKYKTHSVLIIVTTLPLHRDVLVTSRWSRAMYVHRQISVVEQACLKVV